MYAAFVRFGVARTTKLLLDGDEDNGQNAAWGPIALARLEHTLGLSIYPYADDYDGGSPALGPRLARTDDD